MSRGGIRPLRPDDIPAAVALFERVERSGSSAHGLEQLFRAVLFEDPWTDPDLPSLVYEDEDGGLAGFHSQCTRRFLFDGEPLRMSVGIHFFVAPEVRGKAAGALLCARLLGGRQDASHTDGVNDAVLRMWKAMRGTVLQLESLEWTRVLRPAAYWNDRLAAGRAPAGVAAVGRAAAGPLDRALARTSLGGPRRIASATTTDEPLTPEAMVAQLDDLTGWARLRPAYDEPFLHFLLDQLSRTTSWGDLSARLVRRGGRAIGWHIALIRPGGVAETLQLVARPDDLADVLDAYLDHARELGAVAARGRLDPPLVDAISRERSILRRGNFVLLRTASPELLTATLRGDAQLSRLDTNMWMDSRGR